VLLVPLGVGASLTWFSNSTPTGTSALIAGAPFFSLLKTESPGFRGSQSMKGRGGRNIGVKSEGTLELIDGEVRRKMWLVHFGRQTPGFLGQ
jgi:hypothetical protein